MEGGKGEGEAERRLDEKRREGEEGREEEREGGTLRVIFRPTAVGNTGKRALDTEAAGRRCDDNKNDEVNHRRRRRRRRRRREGCREERKVG